MNTILPAILAKTAPEFIKKIRAVESVVSTVHIDIMDSRFVPNETWYDPDALATIETPLQFEYHLMVNDPSSYIYQLLPLPQTHRILWHLESEGDHLSLLRACQVAEREAGLAIRPSSSIDLLIRFSEELNEILILGNVPGNSGLVLDPAMIARARALHDRWPRIPLGFDIGVNEQTIPLLREAGVTRFCTASAVFRDGTPQENLARLQRV